MKYSIFIFVQNEQEMREITRVAELVQGGDTVLHF